MTIQALKRRFDELVAQLDDVEETKWRDDSHGRARYYVDNDLLRGWRVKARNLLSRTCGEESEHYREFVKVEEANGMPLVTTNHDRMKPLSVCPRRY